MRVISGSLKGKNIEIKKKVNFRPTLSRIREDIFNIIMHNPSINKLPKDSVFADIYCGSGSIGIEALSRGFKHCHFNDIDNEQIHIISAFLNKNKDLSYDFSNADLINSTNEIPWNDFDIIYYDPPYEMKLETIILNHIDKIKDNAIIISETNYKIFKEVDSIHLKSYKNKSIGFYESINLKKFLSV